MHTDDQIQEKTIHALQARDTADAMRLHAAFKTSCSSCDLQLLLQDVTAKRSVWFLWSYVQHGKATRFYALILKHFITEKSPSILQLSEAEGVPAIIDQCRWITYRRNSGWWNPFGYPIPSDYVVNSTKTSNQTYHDATTSTSLNIFLEYTLLMRRLPRRWIYSSNIFSCQIISWYLDLGT